MHFSLLNLVVWAGAAAALPQPLWEAWEPADHNSEEINSSKVPTTKATATTSDNRPFTGVPYSIKSSTKSPTSLHHTSSAIHQWHSWLPSSSVSTSAISSSRTNEVADWRDWAGWKPVKPANTKPANGKPGSPKSSSVPSSNANDGDWDHSMSDSYNPSTDTSNWANWNPTGPSNNKPASPANGGKPAGPPSGQTNAGWNFGAAEHESSWNKWSATEPLYSAPATTAILAPARHWKHNAANPDHVVPAASNKMYYATDGKASAKKAHQMAWLSAQFATDTVILDHSDLLTYNFSPSSGSITVTFKSDTALQLAKKSWDVTKGLTLVATDESCTFGGTCYLKPTQLSFDEKNRTCTLSAKNIDFEQAITFFDFEWGNYRPGSRSRNPDKDSTGSGSTTTTGRISSTTTSGSSSGSASSSTTSGASGSTTSGGSGSTTSGGSTTTTSSGTGSTTSGASTSTTSSGVASTTTPGSGSTTSGSGSTTSGTITTSGTTTAGTGSSTTSTSTTTIVDGSSTNSTNGTAAGDYTSGGSSNPNCTAPEDTKYGFPSACLGQWFDDDLDDDLGYEAIANTDSAQFNAQFNDLFYPNAEPLDDEDLEDYSDNNAALGLKKRWWFVPKVLVQAVAAVLPIKGVTTPYEKEITLMSTQLNVPKERTLVASPWGQQVLIKSFSKTSANEAASAKLDIFCVDCGLQGTADIAGKVGISLAEGISSLGATLKADMSMTFKVGVDAQLVYTQTFQQPLFQVPLSPLCVANVICVGPYMRMGADLELKANAQGQILAGASITMHNAQASMDIVQLSASASGWQPEFNPVFEANGKIELSADVGLPLSIALGIDILNGKFKREAALIDRPGLVASAAVSASASLGEDGQITGGAGVTDGCTGIATSLSLKNDVYVTIPGRDNIMLSNPPPKKLASGCIKLPGAEPSSTTTSDATSTTETPNTDPGTGTGDNPTTTTSDASTETPPVTDNGSGTGSDPANPDSAIPKRRSIYGRQSNTTSGGEIQDTTSASLSNGTTKTSDWVQPDSGDKAYNLTDGYEVATLVDSELNYQVLPCANGNLLLFGINETVPDYQCGDMWTMTQDEEVVMADGMARIPVFYPTQMNAVGVSRIRLADVENIPAGAKEIVFVPASTTESDGDTNELYYPVDEAQNTYYTITCIYSDSQPSKVFIANDVTAGIAMLQNPDIKYTITGGEVKQCFYLPLIQGNGSDEGEDNGLETTVPSSGDGDNGAGTDTTTTGTPSENRRRRLY